MGFGGSLGKIGQVKQAYDKYKGLQKALDNLVIRAKEGTYKDDDGNDVQGAVVVDLDGNSKLKNFVINDVSLLNPSRKSELEKLVISTFQKAQAKVQEVMAEKSKEHLGIDPNNLGSLSDMLGGLGG